MWLSRFITSVTPLSCNQPGNVARKSRCTAGFTAFRTDACATSKLTPPAAKPLNSVTVWVSPPCSTVIRSNKPHHSTEIQKRKGTKMCLFYHLFFLHLHRDHYKSMSYMRCKQLQTL